MTNWQHKRQRLFWGHFNSLNTRNDANSRTQIDKIKNTSFTGYCQKLFEQITKYKLQYMFNLPILHRIFNVTSIIKRACEQQNTVDYQYRYTIYQLQSFIRPTCLISVRENNFHCSSSLLHVATEQTKTVQVYNIRISITTTRGQPNKYTIFLTAQMERDRTLHQHV